MVGWSTGYKPDHAFIRNHFVFSSSSLGMEPSALRAARFERLAITTDMPLDNRTNMTASLAGEKNTFSGLLCAPYPCWMMVRTAISPSVKIRLGMETPPSRCYYSATKGGTVTRLIPKLEFVPELPFRRNSTGQGTG